MQELKSRVVKSKSVSMSRSGEDYEIRSRCRCTPMSRQPEEIVEIRMHDLKGNDHAESK
jgi:hypothetical protein